MLITINQFNMKNFTLVFITLVCLNMSFGQNSKSRFVYELHFEVSPTASVLEAEEQFFHFYDGFKNSQYSTDVIALQHHTGNRFDYKILAFANKWDDLEDMMVEAQTHFAKMDPEMMTAAWKISHTGDAIYAVRRNLKEGYISQ